MMSPIILFGVLAFLILVTLVVYGISVAFQDVVPYNRKYEKALRNVALLLLVAFISIGIIAVVFLKLLIG